MPDSAQSCILTELSSAVARLPLKAYSKHGTQWTLFCWHVARRRTILQWKTFFLSHSVLFSLRNQHIHRVPCSGLCLMLKLVVNNIFLMYFFVDLESLHWPYIGLVPHVNQSHISDCGVDKLNSCEDTCSWKFDKLGVKYDQIIISSLH